MRARDPAQINLLDTPFDLTVVGSSSEVLGSASLTCLGGSRAAEEEEGVGGVAAGRTGPVFLPGPVLWRRLL